MRICTDLGLKDVQDYAQKLKKAEKARELKQQVIKIHVGKQDLFRRKNAS